MPFNQSSNHFTEEQIIALFIDAAREGDLDLIKRFLDAGINIDATDSRGHTALIVASYNDRTEAVALLLDCGAAIDAQDSKGASALSGVAFKGHIHTARLLLQRGAKIDHPNHLGRTPLMFALMFERHDVVKLLLAQGANLDLTDADGVCARDMSHCRGAVDAPNLDLTLIKKDPS